jgi:hypothetical protein
LSRLSTSFVLGYHGCEAGLAKRLLLGEVSPKPSAKDYDWLGPGIYFWESDPKRAFEWAQEKVERGDYAVPAIVGAVIDLRNCLDLASRGDIDLVQSAYTAYVELQKVSGLPLAVNKNLGSGRDADRKLRFLDCAVIKQLHAMTEARASEGIEERFDTVRGTFTEGQDAFPGCGFKALTHTQIAVQNPQCILGFFLPKWSPNDG